MIDAAKEGAGARPAASTVSQMVSDVEAALADLQANSLAEERAGCLSDATVARLAEIGVFRMSVPREYGGLAFSTADQFRVYAAIGKIAGSTGWVAWVTETHVRWIAMFSQKARDEVYGMDWPAPRVSGVITPMGPGTARAVEGGFMLKGKWPFCSGCRHSAWSILGTVVEQADGPGERRLMLVPTKALTIVDDWAVSGMKATGSNTVEMAEEIFVPDYRTLRSEDAVAARWASEPPPGQDLYRTSFHIYTTVLSGATPLGMAKGALDYYLARIHKRAITATQYKIQADAPVTHFQLVEAITRIEAAERLLTADAEEVDRRAAADGPWDELFRTKVKYDVAVSVRNCAEAIAILHRGSGASTIHEANPMQRFARDANVVTVHGQFNFETCAEDYGRALCDKPLLGKSL